MTVLDDRRSGRREFVAVAGAIALGGCLGGDGGDRRELDPGPLQSIPSKPVPQVPRRLPAPITSAYLDQSAQRARELLSALPGSIGTAEIPNGAIREEVLEARESAVTSLQRADAAPTPFERMRALREARKSAATAKGAWLAIHENHSREDALAARSELRERRRAFEDEWRYVGDDPIAAILVSRTLEELSRQAAHHLDRAAEPGYVDPDSPPGIGQIAGTLEYARCSLADAEHVYERYRESADDVGSLEGTITDASRGLTQRVNDRSNELPAERPDDPSAMVERDVADTPTGAVLAQAIGTARRQADDVADRSGDGEPATAILEAHAALTAIQAFEALRDRIAEGDDFPIDTAEDVVGYRRDAVKAVREILDEGEHPRLNRRAASRFARYVEYTDARFESIDADSTPSVSQVERDAVGYVRIGTAADVVPAVSETVAAAIETR